MCFGFELKNGSWVEQNPSIFKHLKLHQRRMLFLAQYNWYVDASERVYLKNKNLSLQEAFFQSILTLLPKPLSPAIKPKEFIPKEAVLIHLFLNGDPKKVQEYAICLAYIPKTEMARRIYRVFAKDIPGIVFDARSLFLHFVYEKIANRNKDKIVYIKNDEILIESDGKVLLSVVPYLKEVNKDNPMGIKDEINRAWQRLKESRAQALYLVFPRNENFTRHIEVRNCEHQRARLKLVPYTISHSVKENR
jgi:hypothetical protein